MCKKKPLDWNCVEVQNKNNELKRQRQKQKKDRLPFFSFLYNWNLAILGILNIRLFDQIFLGLLLFESQQIRF